ncbi:unnamed protein product [Rotaria sp. Silwood1]|nr:unnamed protein product [Rotaria sp. Silwood1]CAF3798750.1 unnamed protein product [Rotaria sp. Silwood1]
MMLVVSKHKRTSHFTDCNFLAPHQRSSQSSSSSITWNHFLSTLGNYARGEYLISSIIQQISDLKNEQSFADIYCQITEFCQLNNIDLVEQYRPRRTTAVSARFNEYGDLNAIKNEFMVIKPMIKSKSTSDVIEFLNELLPVASAFPTTIRMIKASITMPISQVTYERSFSKTKLIKTYARNSMNDSRLSDLTALATERSFEIDFEEVIDVFANNHKDSRIILR